MKNVFGQSTHSDEENQRQQKLTREILTYCVEHPDAKDTVEGILTWWFPAGAARWRVEEVKTALRLLTAQGWLTSRSMRHSEEIYGLTKEKVAEIRMFLSGSKTKEVAR